MDPSLCVNGCGFFGSSETKNMCSKCYKDHILQHNKSTTESLFDDLQDSKTSKAKNIIESATTTEMDNIVDRASISSKDALESQKKKKRCKSCNKKIGLTGFMCKCGDLFCGKHRYPEEHSCVVDLKQIGRELLRKKNPLCQADKLDYEL